MIIFVSATSKNHSKSLLQFLNSLYKNVGYEIKCYVYDLGDLTNEYKNNLINLYPNIILKNFDYNKYPDYFNVQINAGQYAWKPAIIHEVLQEELPNINNIDEDHYLFWCDAGDILDNNINELLNITKRNKIYSPDSEGDIKRWTYSKVIEYFNIENNQDALRFKNRNGAIYSFYLNSIEVQQFICDFYKNCLDKNAICPDGSSRSNHRQDQSLFTILYYHFVKNNNLNYENRIFSIKYHNDCD